MPTTLLHNHPNLVSHCFNEKVKQHVAFITKQEAVEPVWVEAWEEQVVGMVEVER